LVFKFNPIAFNAKRFGNGTTICPVPGEAVDGRIVDINCSVDKFETCLVHGPNGFCPQSGCVGQKLVTLVDFLACFEGQHHANFSFLAGCASAAGIDLSHARRCVSDESLRESLWNKQLALDERDRLKHFPTVLLDGHLTDKTDTSGLKEAICARLTGPKPAGCGSKRAPSPGPEKVCLGKRCDTAACPCGCECGTDEDPGLCYVPAEKTPTLSKV